ncbi:unnamed protein product, partial [Dibothriocephalus latus]
MCSPQARAGQCPLKTVLDFTRAYTGEESYSVWSVLAQGLGSVRVLLQEMAYKAGDEVVFSELSPEEVGLNNLYTQLALPVYEKLGMYYCEKGFQNSYFKMPNWIQTPKHKTDPPQEVSLFFLGFDPKPEDSNNDSLLRPIILEVLGRA